MVENNTLPSYMNTGADTVNDDEAELRAAFTAYDEAWQNLDVEVILGYYHYPCMLLTSVGVLVKNSAEQLRPFITGIVNDMNSANYSDSNIAEVSCKQLSNNLALVSMHAVRFDDSGKQIGEGVTTYTFTRADGQWKIAVLAPHDVATMPCYQSINPI